MSIKLKENQLLAAKLLSFGYSSCYVAKIIGIRIETISRWKNNKLFKGAITKQQNCYLKTLEEQHFYIIKKSMYLINKELESNGLSPKEKVNICMRYTNSISIIQRYTK